MKVESTLVAIAAAAVAASPKRDLEAARRVSGMLAQCLRAFSSIDGKHLLKHARGDAIGHQGRQMRLELIQLWRRPAIQWPADTRLRGATCYAPEPGKAHRHLAEKRRYSMVAIVLQ